MKIGYISRQSFFNSKYWSSTPFFLQKKLKKNNKLLLVHDFPDNLRKIYAIKRDLYKIFLKKKIDERYNHPISIQASNYIQKKIFNKKLDFLLTHDSSLVSYLTTDIPIFIWTDATYLTYYLDYFKKKNISKQTILDIKDLETKAFAKSRLIFLSSDWALNSAKKIYPEFKNKFKLMHFPANLEVNFNKNYVLKKIKKKKLDQINFLAIASDYLRKGIRDCIYIINKLNKLGINSRLTIIGKVPKKILIKNVKSIPFIKKNTYGIKKLTKIYFKSNFNFLLSSSEAYGLVLVESCALGVPSIIYKKGGMTDIIKNNLNGYVFNYKEKNKIIKKIEYLYKNPKKYNILCIKTFKYYNSRFTCKSIISNLLKIIKKSINQ